MLALLLGLLALADVPVPAPAPTPYPVTVKRFSPDTPRVGEPVTIEGTGFEQGSVVMVGEMAPRILERSATRLVFAAPRDYKNPQGYKAEVFVVTPGLRVQPAGTLFAQPAMESGVVAGPRPTAIPSRRELLAEAILASGPGAPRTLDVDLGGGSAVFHFTCTGGEVNAEIRGAGAAAPALRKDTWEGRLTWTVTQAALGGTAAAPVRQVALTVSSEKPVSCEVRVARRREPR